MIKNYESAVKALPLIKQITGNVYEYVDEINRLTKIQHELIESPSPEGFNMALQELEDSKSLGYFMIQLLERELNGLGAYFAENEQDCIHIPIETCILCWSRHEDAIRFGHYYYEINIRRPLKLKSKKISIWRKIFTLRFWGIRGST